MGAPHFSRNSTGILAKTREENTRCTSLKIQICCFGPTSVCGLLRSSIRCLRAMKSLSVRAMWIQKCLRSFRHLRSRSRNVHRLAVTKRLTCSRCASTIIGEHMKFFAMVIASVCFPVGHWFDQIAIRVLHRWNPRLLPTPRNRQDLRYLNAMTKRGKRKAKRKGSRTRAA